jgi:hypothetical protein
MQPQPAHCHRCNRITETVYLALSSGHFGNCCGECRATRKGRPFVSREVFNSAKAAPVGGQREHNAQVETSKA